MIKQIHIDNLRKSRFSKIAAVWSLGIIGNESFLAGGALRTVIDNKEEIADFDIFFEEKFPEDAPRFVTCESEDGTVYNPILPPPRLLEIQKILEKEKFKLVFECQKGELYSYKKDGVKIQLILSVMGHPVNVINDFDFGAAAAAFDGTYFYYSTFFFFLFDENKKKKNMCSSYLEFFKLSVFFFIIFK